MSVNLVNKPDIVEVVSERIQLRRAGKEYVGVCLFHNDRHPSFFVNREKGVFLCRACGESGDVIALVMKLDGLTFPEAKAALGINGERPKRPPLTRSRRRAAAVAAAWVNAQRAKLNVLIAERLEQRDLVDEISDFELAGILDRELTMYHGFYGALGYPRGAAEMLAIRESIEQITDGAGLSL